MNNPFKVGFFVVLGAAAGYAVVAVAVATVALGTAYIAYRAVEKEMNKQ